MIDIEMKLVMALGEERMQLECMCGRQFTFAPKEKINTTKQGKARCPNCQTTWSGQIDGLASAFTFKPSHFALYARFNNTEMNERAGIAENPDGCVRVGVGIGVDISHFAMSAIARFCLNTEPVVVIVKLITKEDYEKAKAAEMEQTKANLASMFSQLIDKMEEDHD